MNEFVRILRMIRYCWICGRYGGGKTTLALMLSDILVRSKVSRYVISNTPLAVDVPFETTFDERSLGDVHDSVIILDEAGIFLEDGNKKLLKQWFAFLRHHNQIVLMPSVMPVVRYASMLRCQRMFNGLQLGIPTWLYRWELRMLAASDKGWFFWWNPASVFGLVDTNYDPDGSWFIYDFSNEAVESDGDGEFDGGIGGESTGEQETSTVEVAGVGVGIGSGIVAYPGVSVNGWFGG